MGTLRQALEKVGLKSTNQGRKDKIRSNHQPDSTIGRSDLKQRETRKSGMNSESAFYTGENKQGPEKRYPRREDNRREDNFRRDQRERVTSSYREKDPRYREPRIDSPPPELQRQHNFCDSCGKDLPDVEYYEHDHRGMSAKWLCCLCADKFRIPDICRQTNQSDFARKRCFRREYGATKRFFR